MLVSLDSPGTRLCSSVTWTWPWRILVTYPRLWLLRNRNLFFPSFLWWNWVGNLTEIMYPPFYFFSVKGNITESAIIATIHCPDVGYYLFGISLVTYIPYHVSCTFPMVIVSFWVILSFARLFTPLAPCTQLGYSTLPTMYYWISTSVAIPCLFDSITCFVSYILSPLYLFFRT